MAGQGLQCTLIIALGAAELYWLVLPSQPQIKGQRFCFKNEILPGKAV